MELSTTTPRFDRRVFIQRFGLLISFGLLFVALSLLSDRFLTVSNLLNVLRQASINGIIAVGMTFVILTAGIDLSVGSILALSVVIGADLLVQGIPVPAAVLAALAVGAGLGAINGVIIARGRIPSFIATLGMFTVARGLALMYTGGAPITGLPASFRFIGAGSFLGIPSPILIAGLTYVVGSFVLSRTTFGEYVYMFGDNPVASRLAGAPNRVITVAVFAIAGLCSALAGLILIGRLNSAQPTIGLGYEFDAIAAVVVGGTSFSGGEGTLLGTLIGALLIETLNNGMNLLNVNPLWEQVVKGVVIALALLLYKAVSRER